MYKYICVTAACITLLMGWVGTFIMAIVILTSLGMTMATAYMLSIFIVIGVMLCSTEAFLRPYKYL